MIDRSERASATTELVLVVPGLLFLVLLIFQFALVMHTRNLVGAAAQDGARAARVEGGTAADARAAAAALLVDSGATIAGPPRIDVVLDDERVRVEVSARVIAVVPGFGLDVDAASSAPVERYRGVA